MIQKNLVFFSVTLAALAIAPTFAWAQEEAVVSKKPTAKKSAPAKPKANTEEPALEESPAPAKRSFDLGLLSEEERAIYNKGEITTGKMIAGGLLGSQLGFGSGHIV